MVPVLIAELLATVLVDGAATRVALLSEGDAETVALVSLGREDAVSSTCP